MLISDLTPLLQSGQSDSGSPAQQRSPHPSLLLAGAHAVRGEKTAQIRRTHPRSAGSGR